MPRIQKSLILIVTAALVVMLGRCAKTKPAASSTQTSVGINTVGGWSDSPFISRDGQRLYFMYSRYDFAPWLKSGGKTLPVASGPDRPGLHKSATNPFDESDIYMATRNADGTWGTPVNLGFNGAYGDSSGMEINGGNTFVWLRGDGASNHIVVATKNSDGSWSAPTDLGSAVNLSGYTQDNPDLSEDGKTLIFTSNRPGGVGGKDLWISTNSAGPTGGSWSTPANLGATIDSTGDEDQAWYSSITSELYWNGPSGLMHCPFNGSACSSTAQTLTIPGCGYVAEASMPDDGQSIYFGCGDTSTFEVKIMYSTKQSDGSWGTATPVD